MDRGKKIEVSASTLVDLKAELYRKQEELKRSKGTRPHVIKPTALKFEKKQKELVDSLGKSNPRIESRQANDQQWQSINEDQDALAASRRKLEEKARLYDKMMTTTDFQDEDEVYMVDFQRKALSKDLNNASRPTVYELNEEPEDVADPTTYTSKNETEEWVDYTDSLGRSRRCLKRDLPQMIAMDEDLKKRKTEASPQRDSFNEEHNEELGDEEDETDYVLEVPQTGPATGPIHYQNVQHNEKRTHGVGYFAFSQSAEERSQQMEMLNQLRNQTKEQRARSEKLKEKRQATLQARLQKVKDRKKLQSGGTLSDSDELDKEVQNEDEQVVTAVVQEPAVLKVETPEEKKDKPTNVRPWDRGKVGPVRVAQPFRKVSQKEWVDKQRDQRNAEFAPPQSYHKRDRIEEMRQFFMQQKEETARMQQHQQSQQIGGQQQQPSLGPLQPPPWFDDHVVRDTQIDSIPLPADT